MRLLISVTGAHEVEAAVAGGADIIDVKDPREGSLGAGPPHVIRHVRRLTPPQLPVSVAIGDLPDLPGTAALAAAGAAACGVQFIKVGLMGPPGPDEARTLMAAVCRAAREQDPDVRIIASAYADAERVGAVSPLDVPRVALDAGADGCMIDTAGKGHVTLFSALSRAEIESFVLHCRELGLLCALAGSLSAKDAPLLRAVAPDIAGFRAAACRGDRLAGIIDESAVGRLKEALAAASPDAAATP